MAVTQQILETLNPIGISQTPEKTIRIVCWVLAIGFLYHLFSNLNFLFANAIRIVGILVLYGGLYRIFFYHR